MSHSFLCIVGHWVYPRFGYMSYAVDADFDRFLPPPAADAYDALTYQASTS